MVSIDSNIPIMKSKFANRSKYMELSMIESSNAKKLNSIGDFMAT